MKKTLILALLILLSMTMFAQTAGRSDDDAYATIQQLYPYGGFVQRVRLPGMDSWTFEVGRIDIFGRRLVLAHGGSWEGAFADLNRQIMTPVGAPLGGQ